MIIERQSKSVKIARSFVEELHKRHLPAGASAGSVRDLKALYNISHVTADKVLRILVEQDVLVRHPRKGTFLKHDSPVELKIGFTGSEVPTYDTDVYHMIHIRLVKQAFREVGVKINYISYDTLLDPRKSAAVLSDLNGLLLQKMYLDEHTLPQFQKFSHPMVLVGTNSIEDSLLASQVMTDWKTGFVRLQPLVDPFKRILILTAGHPNATAQESMIRNVFTRHEIETVMFPCSNPQLQAFKYFLGHRTGYEDTVIFSLSGFFSQGLLDAFGTETLPAVIECDNMEKYLIEQNHNAVFTAIDAMLEMTYNKAMELLSRQIQQKENNRQILMIPPDLIFRKSFVPNQ